MASNPIDSNSIGSETSQIFHHDKFKGVVVKPNGHWGAQIYANHQRVWLGTFQTEYEAAKAYDSAAIRLRGGNSQRNFPWTDTTHQEPLFQDHYTTEMILQMIKDGSYPLKFANFLTFKRSQEMMDENGYVCRTLFQKELTLSDVGNLNRLVIPKRHAIMYFPARDENMRAEEEITMLTFMDVTMRKWRFRYCYWKSSQSYVLTKGWNRFVKEKKLKEKDLVVFSTCMCMDGQNMGHSFFMIGVIASTGNRMDHRDGHLGLEPDNIVVEPKMDGESEDGAVFGEGSIGLMKNVVRIFGVEITSQN